MIIVRLRRGGKQLAGLMSAEGFSPQGHFWFGVYAGRRLVAAAAFSVLADGVGVLHSAVVAASHRGLGLQSRLIAARLRELARWDCRYVYASAPTAHRVSLRNLRAAGFRKTAHRPDVAFRGHLTLRRRPPRV